MTSSTEDMRPKQSGDNYGYNAERAGVDTVERSARIVVPLLMRQFKPRSVLDLGCGTGDWLHVFQLSGVAEIIGYDGEWVHRGSLKIPTECFRILDFYASMPELPRVDVGLCLEVGEHVAESICRKMIASLTRCADVIVWSAAVPGQGGSQHINEQYQDYWIALFLQNGFTAFDLLRPSIWGSRDVSWYYQQNMLVFANPAGQVRHELIPTPFIASVIHPKHYERVRNPRNYSIKQILWHMPHYLTRRFRKPAEENNDNSGR